MHKKLLSIVVLSILVASTLVGCGQPSTLTVFSTSGGNVSVTKAGTGSWIEAEAGMSLEPGDIIKTGDNSNAEITFLDGSTIELEAGTEIEVVSLDISTDTSSATIVLKQTIGSIIFRVIKLIDPASRYEVETPTGAVAIRGSAVQIYVTEDGTTWVTNLEGEIWAIAQGVELHIPEGWQCVIRPGQPPELSGDGDGVETRQYGGELTVVVAGDPAGWDDAIVPHYETIGPYECLWSGDWAKGTAGGYGTGECDWLLPGEVNRLEHKTGYIADSYEIGDDYIIFHLRDGVLWHDKYPCNGREVTADDVVFSLERQMTLDTAYLHTNYPHVASAMSVAKVDEDTVRVDCAADQMLELLSLIDFMYIYPEDVIELYGDMNDWERAIGTGAFTLEEYVEGSYLYYERNPDYWGTNPVGPGEGDQLPYLDSVRFLIQPDPSPDPSTQDSLFTTGQVDIIACDTDRAQALMDLPGVECTKYFYAPSYGRVLFMRLDKEDKPWADVRVRQAMQLAIDNQRILDALYGGDGEMLYWPVYYCPEYASAYVPLEHLEDDMIEVSPGESISVADLFGYNLELAQELMDAAGYPDGFQAQVDVYNHYIDMDPLQLVVNMLDDIGIELTINALHYATITTTWATGSYPDMLYTSYAGIGTYFKGINWSGTTMWNTSNIDDPVLNDYRDQMLAAYPDEDTIDQIHAEMIPYLLEQCYAIQTAGANVYRFWWPWVKNYSGEGSVGYYKALNPSNNYACVWIDEELKAATGHGG